MDKMEQLLKSVLKTGPSGEKHGKCLSDDEMAILMENKCSSREEEKYSRHILSCHGCSDLLKNYILAAKEVERGGELETPSWLLERVKGLVPAEESKSTILDLVLELKDKFLELIETTGELPMALKPAFALRDAKLKQPKDEKGSGTIHVVKAFRKFSADVEIEKKVTDTTDLVLRLTDNETKRKADGVRASLFQNSREIESVILENGKAKFEDIEPKSYKIVLSKEGVEIGEINVSITAKK